MSNIEVRSSAHGDGVILSLFIPNNGVDEFLDAVRRASRGEDAKPIPKPPAWVPLKDQPLPTKPGVPAGVGDEGLIETRVPHLAPKPRADIREEIQRKIDGKSASAGETP